MDYKITMPQLSDSMSEGKLVEWKVKEGQKVKSADVIADIESDKAVIEVQTFKDGIVKKLLLKEGDEAKVGTVIAIIDTDMKSAESDVMQQNKSKEKIPKKETIKQEEEKVSKKDKPHEIAVKSDKDIVDFLFGNEKEEKSLPKGISTPAAKQKAFKFDIDIEKLQNEEKLPTPAFEKDIDQILVEKYFTPKAKKLFDKYSLNFSYFKLDHKIDSDEVKNYIRKYNIPKIIKPSANQKSVMNTVVKSWNRPIYHIYEEVSIKKKENIKLTANILKALANSMCKYEFTRTVLKNDTFKVYPSSNISVALSKDDSLYMVVLKNVDNLSLKEINNWLKEIKTKKLSSEDLSGSTFGISNLGMFDIESFDALINADDCGIAAFGAMKESRMKVIFTFDHRIVNGVRAAQFVTDFKKELEKI